MAKYNVHAGHNPDGKTACGACGIIKESTEARKVKNYLISYLRAAGHTVYDCTCENGTIQSDVLKKIVRKCNAHKVSLDISIHFNSGAGDKKGNGKTTGTEVLIYSSKSASKGKASNICKSIAALGFKNRGVKVRNNLYVLKNTKSPALLIECCFVDDKDDCNKYSAKEMAKAIYKGITGKAVQETGLKATSLKKMVVSDIIKKVGPLFTADQKKTGVLASVSLAQFILESDFGRSELAQNANNCFGMKQTLSGNKWSGSAWDGKSVYNKKTKEYVKGKYITITAPFRKYPDIEHSIADHSAYLIGAMNGSKKRYAGLKGEKNHKKAITIIKNGGYATSPKYIENICNVIMKYNLTQYDAK